MTLIELLLGGMAVVGLYYLLRPLQRALEILFLKLLGVENPRFIDVDRVPEKQDKPPKE
jgi:hypothetical protein